MSSSHHYSAKLLLAGEYAVIKSGKALGVPLPEYFAHWVLDSEPDESLMDWVQFLSQLPEANKWFHLSSMRREVENGWQLHSNIPMGCGLGSSGAVVAAFWDRYSKDLILGPDQLKKVFSMMESYFHGSSSGLDPLIIYSRRPVMVGHSQVSLLDKTIALGSPEYQIRLVDSGLPRKTQQWVSLFEKKMSEEEFSKAFYGNFLPSSSALVDAFISDLDGKIIREHWLRVSEFQKSNMAEFIPAALQEDWITANHAYKICGAGGGGYFLKMEYT